MSNFKLFMFAILLSFSAKASFVDVTIENLEDFGVSQSFEPSCGAKFEFKATVSGENFRLAGCAQKTIDLIDALESSFEQIMKSPFQARCILSHVCNRSRCRTTYGVYTINWRVRLRTDNGTVTRIVDRPEFSRCEAL